MFQAVATLALFALLMKAGATVASPSGLLLGISFDHDARYQTLWVYDEGGTVRILSAPDLLVPRGMGFWRIGSYTTLLEDTQNVSPVFGKYTEAEEHLWAAPADRKPLVVLSSQQQLVQPPVSAFICTDISREIHFVTPSHVWYETRTNYECGVHPDFEDQMHVTSIESLDGERIAISAMLGQAGVDAFRRAVGSAYDEAHKEAGFECPPSEDLSNWTIVRAQGAWAAEGWADTHRLCGYGLELKIPVALPPALTGYDRLPKTWNELAAEIPNLADAFASPSGNLLVAISNENTVLAYRLEGLKLGARVFRYLPDRFGQIVMAQWAIGANNVGRWTEQVKATKEFTPIVRHR